MLSADHTAFICVIDEEVEGSGSFKRSEKVIVPSLKSFDYKDRGNMGMGRSMMMMKCSM